MKFPRTLVHFMTAASLFLCTESFAQSQDPAFNNTASNSLSDAINKQMLRENPENTDKKPWPAIQSTLPQHQENRAIPESQSPDASSARCAYMECIPLIDTVDDVYYTVKKRNSVMLQASEWGVPANVIMTLNTGLTPETMLEPGQKLLVEARLPSQPVPYSRGKCNRGRINDARLMPEGTGYFLRTIRSASWGTNTTIQALMTMFKLYREKYPDAPDINMGDISRRRGGKIRPHKSHQSGRDVDFGFVHTVAPNDHRPENFIRANADNLDVEKTWFLIKTLIQTGTVKTIYVDRTVMKQLYNYAAPSLTQEQRELIFSNPRHENSASALMHHWPGHRNYFYVRFNCPPDQPICHQ